MTYIIVTIMALCILIMLYSILKEPKPLIKCNINASGKKIYHLPTDKLYNSITINYSKGECTVKTIKEAEKKGFTRTEVK